MPSGAITFPGVVNPQRLVATRTVGTRPDVAVLFANPQAGSPDCSGTATLSFSFNGVTINWTNALCDRATLRIGPQGQVYVIEIKDQRWRWQKAYITQAYNVRYPDGSVDTTSQATVAQIASALLTAMGETGFDVSAITTTELPEIVYDHDKCADVLEELLGARGYVVSLQTNNTAKVYVRGTGFALPVNTDVVSVSMSINPPEIPLLLTACGDKTLVQSKLACQAVGRDTNGTIGPVASLSYAPSGGWDGTDMEGFGWMTDPVAKECALESVGKWYQIYQQADGTQNINFGGTNYCPGQISVSNAWQYLPIEPTLLQTYTDPFNKLRNQPPYVEGTFFNDVDQDDAPKGQNTGPFVRVNRREYTFDRENGIIRFKDLAIRKNPGPIAGINTFALVYITCVYSVHDLTTFVKDRYVNSINLGGYGQDLRKLDEIQRQIIVGYAANSGTVNSITDNLSSLNAYSNLYLNTAANTYVATAANLLLYRGIYAFNTDGVALQIRWDVAVGESASPFGTHVAQNFEGIPLLPSDRDKRILRRTMMMADPTNRRNKKFRAGRKRVM